MLFPSRLFVSPSFSMDKHISRSPVLNTKHFILALSFVHVYCVHTDNYNSEKMGRCKHRNKGLP